MTVRHYITEALRILESRSTDPVAIPGAIERLLDALYALDTSREMTEKVTTIIGRPVGTDPYIKVTNHKARVVLDG